MCCTIKKDMCQCNGGADVGLEDKSEGGMEESGGSQEMNADCEEVIERRKKN